MSIKSFRITKKFTAQLSLHPFPNIFDNFNPFWSLLDFSLWMSISTYNIATLGWILTIRKEEEKCFWLVSTVTRILPHSVQVLEQRPPCTRFQGWVPGSPAFPQVLMGLTWDGILSVQEAHAGAGCRRSLKLWGLRGRCVLNVCGSAVIQRKL